ncbi:fungal pheromone mating factor STE2 GPCR-domain-containing protein [Podospora aff. communis PSN243]|uniref:Fungal pheromone mating factor STE2 GPCR-domain-containing protein n=1 Tax=Podospora aff. communis PSN243 TaxID=3040156 RepID=A0AAV9GX86_9PEZI|nr:fungal pheromone mating factor STE2 GPCR-domain-containing protein [Podospora aff. communis PSN243]
MASSNTSSAPGPLLRPEEQLVVLLGPTGSDNITVPLSEIDMVWSLGASGAISYGSQVGACFMMLVVLLGMTPRHRFKRAPTIVHILALIFNMVRMLLLALYFPSTWYDLYTQMTGDVQFVAQMDYNISVAATILGLPVTILILAALVLQAWSMMQLWQRRYKIPTAMISVLLVVVTIAFNILNVVQQTNYILNGTRRQLWMRKTFLGLICSSITWFCFLFNSRLVIHMWQNRTILPSLKGLNAMDVLVITNGFLMIIPVLFAFLEFGNFSRFEAGSVTWTSVVVVLPLGTLIAQRLANPRWFSSPELSVDASAGGASGRRLLNTGATGNGGNNASFQTQSTGVVKSQISSEPRCVHADHVDAQLARNDDADLEQGVRVDYTIERSEEKLRSGSGSS